MLAALAADPRVAEWRAAVAAARKPLSPAQLAALRPACQRMARHMEKAASGRTETAPSRIPPSQERNTA